MRYGHLCTHRCDDHWNWNLEIEEIYFVKDKDYAKVFIETNEMTREIITTVLNNGNVRVKGESDAGGAEKVLKDTEENDDYWKESEEEKIDEGVTEGYTGSSICSVSESAKEQDLCEPIHIEIEEIETFVEVREDHDIQLESVMDEYT